MPVFLRPELQLFAERQRISAVTGRRCAAAGETRPLGVSGGGAEQTVGTVLLQPAQRDLLAQSVVQPATIADAEDALSLAITVLALC